MNAIINLIRVTVGCIKRSLEVKIKKKLKLPIKPIFINFIITYRCNSHCLMCNIWQKYKKNNKLLKKELTLLDIKKFLRKNKDFLSSVKNIGLTGGEALLREDIVEIIKIIHGYLPQTRIGIQTNGLSPKLLEDKLRQIMKFYPAIGLAVSLDGIGEIHNKVRGIKGAFDKYQQTIAIAKKLNFKDISSGLTINNLNYNHIDETANFVAKQNIEFSCFLPDVSDYYFSNKKKTSLNLTTQRKQIIINSLKKFKYHYFMDNLRRYLEFNQKRKLPCYSGYASITLDPYGNVRSCILRSEIFGNIKNKLLKNILFDKHGWEVRNKQKGCSCWSQCEISTSVLVDIFNVFRWFIFSSDKKLFLEKIIKKINRY